MRRTSRTTTTPPPVESALGRCGAASAPRQLQEFATVSAARPGCWGEPGVRERLREAVGLARIAVLTAIAVDEIDVR